jgi:hypothetical protein
MDKFLGDEITYIANDKIDEAFDVFKDKPNASSFLANPLSELTQKAIDRRTNLGIAITAQDAPIENSYIQNIQNLGFTVTDKS